MAAFVDRFCPASVEPNRFRQDADTVLFVHIPKTAGMAVGKSLQQAFDHFYAVEWDNAAVSFRKLARHAAYVQSTRAVRQIIMGHFGWSELRIFRNQELPLKAATIFREPVQRVISNYNYNRSSAHPGHEKFVQRHPTLESYVLGTDFDVQLSQAIGIVSSFDDVLAKLTRYYTFLGLTERLAQSLDFFSKSHGLPPMKEYRANVGPRAADELPAAIRRLIAERNQNDMKVHALMLELYGLTKAGVTPSAAGSPPT